MADAQKLNMKIVGPHDLWIGDLCSLGVRDASCEDPGLNVEPRKLLSLFQHQSIADLPYGTSLGRFLLYLLNEGTPTHTLKAGHCQPIQEPVPYTAEV